MAERRGYIEAIFGPMYSGKTGELIDQIERLSYADMNPVLVKPSNDTRYSTDEVVTHGGKSINAYPVNRESPDGVYNLVKKLESEGEKIDVVGIDEGQFFTDGIIDSVRALVYEGKIVVVAGLDTDFRDEPFGAMPILIAIADKKVQKTAVCTYRDDVGEVCGKEATKTQRLVEGQPAWFDDPIIFVGGKEAYEAWCRVHHTVKGAPLPKLLEKTSE